MKNRLIIGREENMATSRLADGIAKIVCIKGWFGFDASKLDGIQRKFLGVTV